MATAPQLPAGAALTPFAARLAAQPRERLEALAEAVVALLDLMDGDIDLEENDAEDTFLFSEHASRFAAESGPGCPIADAGGGNVEDEGEDIDEREEEHPWIEPVADPAAYADQVRRIRRTRCLPRFEQYRNWAGGPARRNAGYQLRSWPVVPSGRQLLKRKRGMPKRPRP